MERAMHERGAALIMILLFTALMFILVTTMLTTGGNEIVISGLHRDGVRALDHAEAGLRDAISRMQGGRTWKLATLPAANRCDQRDGTDGFRSSLDDNTCVAVIEQSGGASASYLEVRSESRVGIARRRISALVLAAEQLLPPDIFFGFALSTTGTADITGGDVYSRTFVKFKDLPTDANTLTYAGWKISKNPGGEPPESVPACYTHATCTGPQASRWFPGHRRGAYEEGPLYQTISPQPHGTPQDNRILNDGDGSDGVLEYACPAGPVPTDRIDSRPEYNSATDKRNDTNGPMNSTELLYGCTEDNLPYTWVREVFYDPDAKANVYMWFKTIRYEQWFSKYWVLGGLTFRKRGQNPDGSCTPGPDSLCDPANWKFGAVPQFPPIESLIANADQHQSGGGTISASSSIDFGYCANPLPDNPPCTSTASRRTIVLLDNGNYKINKNEDQAHGITVVRGDLEINGNFTYYGLLIVEGTLTLGSGTVTVIGGVVAKETAELFGTIEVKAGILVPNARVGPLSILSNVWWER